MMVNNVMLAMIIFLSVNFIIKEKKTFTPAKFCNLTTNPEKIWNHLILGLNEIVNKIATTRIIQGKKSYELFVNKEVLEHIIETKAQLTKAIVSNGETLDA